MATSTTTTRQPENPAPHPEGPHPMKSNTAADPERFEELAAAHETRKLTLSERLEMSGDQESELGKRVLQRAEAAVHARMSVDPVYSKAWPTAEDKAEIAAAQALLVEPRKALNEAIRAAEAAGQHEQGVRREDGNRYDGRPPSPEMARRLTEARELSRLAGKMLTEAQYDHERAHAAVQDIERAVSERVARRFRVASHEANKQGWAQAARETAQREAARRVDPRPAALAGALGRLRKTLTGKAA